MQTTKAEVKVPPLVASRVARMTPREIQDLRNKLLGMHERGVETQYALVNAGKALKKVEKDPVAREIVGPERMAELKVAKWNVGVAASAKKAALGASKPKWEALMGLIEGRMIRLSASEPNTFLMGRL